MRRVIVILMALAMLAAGSAGKPVDKVHDHKVDVCHMTGSVTNPAVMINVANQGWVNGHDKASHQGDRDLKASDDQVLLKGPTFKNYDEGVQVGNATCPAPEGEGSSGGDE